MNKLTMTTAIAGAITMMGIGMASETQACTADFVVNTNSLNVRKGPSTSSQIIGGAKRGEKYIGIEERDGWLRIQFTKNKEGWVAKQYMKQVETDIIAPQEDFFEGKTTANLNVRAGAGTGYRVITTLPKGTPVDVRFETTNGWYRVEYRHNGRFAFGYVSKQYVVKANY